MVMALASVSLLPLVVVLLLVIVVVVVVVVAVAVALLVMLLLLFVVVTKQFSPFVVCLLLLPLRLSSNDEMLPREAVVPTDTVFDVAVETFDVVAVAVANVVIDVVAIVELTLLRLRSFLILCNFVPLVGDFSLRAIVALSSFIGAA